MKQRMDFWARRKAAVQAEAEAIDAVQEQQALAQEHAALEDKTDAEVLAELDLPDPDTLKMGDDFSAFMARSVPERLRRRALRTLWRSNPVLANLDKLNDYDDDYTDAATVVENMKTAYRVGQGMLKHIEEVARQAAAEASPDAADDIDMPEPEQEEPEVLTAFEPDPEVADALVPQPEEEVLVAPTPRRMKFRIEENAA